MRNRSTRSALLISGIFCITFRFWPMSWLSMNFFFLSKKKKKRQQCFETTQTVVQGMLAHYNSVSVLEFVRNYEGKARNNVAGLRLCIKWVFCVCNSHNISCATTYSIVSGKNMMAVQGESPSLEFIWRRGELIRWFCAFLFTNNA